MGQGRTGLGGVNIGHSLHYKFVYFSEITHKCAFYWTIKNYLILSYLILSSFPGGLAHAPEETDKKALEGHLRWEGQVVQVCHIFCNV